MNIMKNMKLLKLATITVILGLEFVISTKPAKGAVFDFSYKFLTGNTVSGTVEGDLNGNIVEDLRNLSAIYSAEPNIKLNFTDNNSTFSFSGNNTFFDGFENDPNIPSPTRFGGVDNFGFSLTDSFIFNGIPAPNGATVGIFATGNGIRFPFGAGQREAEVYSPSRWSLTQRSISVPEPDTIGGMVVAGFFGILLKKKLVVKKG